MVKARHKNMLELRNYHYLLHGPVIQMQPFQFGIRILDLCTTLDPPPTPNFYTFNTPEILRKHTANSQLIRCL